VRDFIIVRVLSVMDQRLKHLRLCLNDGAVEKCRNDSSDFIIDCVQGGLVWLLSVMLGGRWVLQMIFNPKLSLVVLLIFE
jgi:hypothetical protein